MTQSVRQFALSGLCSLGLIATAAAAEAMPLQPSTIEDWRAAEMDGTGCYWSERRDGPVFFVAAGDIALTRVAGAIVRLSPAPLAADLYPFTHDMWRAGQLEVRIVDTAVAEEVGTESITTAADLIILHDGLVTRLHGSMICGS